MSRVVLAVSALAGLALTLSGCGGSGSDDKKIPPIGGVYTNPNLFKPKSGNFSGLCVVSDRDPNELTDKLTFIGTDDGAVFWNVRGEWTDKAKGELIAHFSHRGGGLTDRTGVLSEDGIAWNNSDSWSPLEKPGFTLTQQPLKAASAVGGLYIAPKLHKSGTFKGIRMVGANYFPDVTFVGSEDGVKFWTILGRWDNVAGQFRADFTPLGGDNTTGKLDSNAILWKDGTYWQKEAMSTNSSKLKAFWDMRVIV